MSGINIKEAYVFKIYFFTYVFLCWFVYVMAGAHRDQKDGIL